MKIGYVARFKGPGLAKVGCNNTEWLNELGNNTKLVKLRYGIIVYHTLTDDFDLENANIETIEKIMEEHDVVEQGFQIEDLSWLK